MKLFLTIRFCTAMLLLFSTTGCWDAREIQNINYITAFAVDYVKGEYVLYAQMLDFTSVAKQEGGKPNQSAQVWVSKTTGVSVNDAVDKLYRTAQQSMYYSHINAIIYSEAVLRHGPEVVFDLSNRYREIRYTKWAFSSRDSLEKILSTTPFFNESPLSSILNEPRDNYRQNSFIMPLQFQRFISYFNETGKTSYLPTLKLNDSVWKENLKKHTLLEIDGCVFMDHRGKVKGYMSRDELSGWRWGNPRTIRSLLPITEKGKFIATLVIHKPRVEIEPVIQGDKAYFRLSLTYAGTLNELGQTISKERLEALAEKQIMKEVKKTYEEGLKHDIDVFQLSYSLYLRNPAVWKKLFGAETSFPLNKNSLQSLKVQVKLENTGKYELRE